MLQGVDIMAVQVRQSTQIVHTEIRVSCAIGVQLTRARWWLIKISILAIEFGVFFVVERREDSNRVLSEARLAKPKQVSPLLKQVKDLTMIQMDLGRHASRSVWVAIQVPCPMFICQRNL